MTPSPLAPPALPVTPAAPGPPDTARRAFDDCQAASGAADFPGLMAAVLAPPPVVTAGGEAPATVADGPAADDQPSPSSLEALVSALAQQASGLSQRPAADQGTSPDAARPELPGATASDRSPAPAGLVDRWATAAVEVAADSDGPAAGSPVATPPRDHRTGPPDGPVAVPAPPDQNGDAGNAVAALARGDRTAGDGSAVAALAHADRGDDRRSPVAGLAGGDRGDDTASPGSAVAALAHADRGDGTRSPVAALADEDRRGGAGSPVAALARHDGGDGSTGSDGDAAADAVSGLGSDPAAAVRSVWESGAAAASGATGPSVAPLRRSPNGVAGQQITAPPVAGHAPARATEAITAPADAAPAATPAAVADQIVSAVVPLHGRGDGRHDVTLELRPADLGTIRVEVSVEHQTVHLTLHAAEPATVKLLAAALPELRSSLADAGLTAGHLGVGPDGSGAGWRRRATGDGDHGPAGRHRRAGDGADPVDDPVRPGPVRPLRPAAAGRLDLLL